MKRPRTKIKRPKMRRRSQELSALATAEYAELQIKYEEMLVPLTPQQREFVEIYLATGDLTDSARQAGYVDPNVQGTLTAKKKPVSDAIDAGRRMLAERHRIKADDLLEELKMIAHSNVLDFKFNKDGDPIVEPGQEWKWKAVASWKKRIVPRKGGEPEVHVEFKLHPKLDSIRLLGQHTGTWQGDGAAESVHPPSVIVLGIDADRVIGKTINLPTQDTLPVLTVQAETVEAEIVDADQSSSDTLQ